MVRLPSASRLSLGMRCAGSFILPQVRSESGEAAKRGTEIHALVERFFKEGRTAQEGATDEQRAFMRRADGIAGPLARDFEKPELAVAVYPGTGHSELYRVGRRSDKDKLPDGNDGVQSGPLGGRGSGGAGLQRDDWGLGYPSDSDEAPSYWKIFSSDQPDYKETTTERPPDAGPDRLRSFFGIADLIQGHGGNSFSVIDWKTGSSYCPEPRWNWQLIVPAVGLWIAMGRPAEYHCSLVLGYLDRDNDNAQRFDADSEFCSRALYFLKKLYNTARTSTPDNVTLYEGKHCVFCNARDRCPAKIGALVAALECDPTGEIRKKSTDEDVMRAIVGIQETSAMRKKAGEEILGRHGGVCDLGDGREAVLNESGKRKKIYTRKRKANQNEQAEGSDAAENDQPGTASGGAEGAGGVGGDGEG